LSNAEQDYYRESTGLPSISASGLNLTTLVNRQEDLTRLAAAIQELSPNQRQVIELRSQGQSFDQIGPRMNCSAESAKILWGQAVTRLLKLLDDEAT